MPDRKKSAAASGSRASGAKRGARAPNSPSGPAARFPMGLVTRRTGLSPDVLRVWERRYGVVKPARSAGGQRLYTPDDVERLILLQRAVRAGYGIARAAQLSAEELVAAASSVEAAGGAREYGGASSESVVTTAIAAVDRFDAVGLEAQLRRASTLFPSNTFLEDVIGALLREVGNRWHEGAISPAHEHLATATVRRVLDWIGAALDAAPDAPVIAFATLPGEEHEIGAMLAARVAAECGWRVRYFGAGLPPDHLAAAANHLDAAMVALSVVNIEPEQRNATLDQISALRRALPDSVLLVAGGRGADGMRPQLEALDVRVPEGMSNFRDELRRHQERLTRERHDDGV